MATETMARAVELKSVSVERRNDAGDVLGTAELDPEIFGRTPNIPLMHQVVTAQLAARRSGTQSTKTRAEVAGGGAKPYRQKGTGRARQGTIRAPQFAGGGVALGPKPRSYAQRTPRKMTRLALFCALSDRAAEGRVCLVDEWSFPTPKTKDAIKALEALELEGNILVVLSADDTVAERSFANLPEVDLVEAGQLTAYDVLVNDWIVFTDSTLPGSVSLSDEGARKHVAPEVAPSSAAEETAESDDTSADTDVTDEAQVSEEEAEASSADASADEQVSADADVADDADEVDEDDEDDEEESK